METSDVSKPSLSELVSDILVDAKNLFVRELELAKREVAEDIRKTKTAAAALFVGLGVLGIGITLLLLALVHMIAASTSLPLWECYGLVGLLVGGLGAGLLILAKNKAAEVDFIPEKTAAAVKEDVGWIKASMMPNKSESRPAKH
jgi:hypothetical protein